MTMDAVGGIDMKSPINTSPSITHPSGVNASIMYMGKNEYTLQTLPYNMAVKTRLV